MKPFDPYCKRSPSQIEEYVRNMDDDPDPDRYVIENEGTYNPESGHFACTDCYIKLGMPSSPRGWRAP